MNKKLTALITVLGLTAMFVAGCGVQNVQSTQNAPPQVAEGKNSVIVAMGTTSEPEAGFDPAYGWGAGEHVHEPLIQSTLTVTNPELYIENDLATDVSVSTDGLKWTVKIRDDVSFTDGEKLTAEDVAFTYNTVKEKSTVNDFTMLKEAVATDATTVEFIMEKPYAIWPYSMAIVGIVPKHAYNESYGQNPIGSGRYMLKQWDKGQQIILEANPNYYGDAPQIKNVTIVFMSEDASFAALNAGQIDISDIPATYANNDVAGYNLLEVQTVDNRGVNMPSTKFDGTKGNDITADLAVRQAINIGINREELINNVLNGYGTPAYSVCDKMPWFSENNVVEYNLEQAKTMLDEAGWIAGQDGIRAKDGVKGSLTVIYPTGDSVRQAFAADFVNQLKNLGFEGKTEGVGWDTAYDRAQKDLMVWGWGAHTPMELYNIYHTIGDTGLAEYSPYANKNVDKFMDDALKTDNLETSYKLWQQAQYNNGEGIAKEVPWVWLANVSHLYRVRDGLKVAEQKIHPHGHGWSIVNNVDKWSWE